MRAKLCLLLCSITLSLASAQSPSFDQLFDNTPESDDVIRFELSGIFFNLTASNDDGDDHRMQGIKSIKFLGADGHSLISRSAVNKMRRGLRAESFEPLTEIRSDGDYIQFMIKEKGNIITDFVTVIEGKEGVWMLAIEGTFDLDDVRNLDIDMDGMDKIKKATKDIPRA